MNKEKITIACDPSFCSTGVAIFRGKDLVSTATIKTTTKDKDRFGLIALNFRHLLQYGPEVLIIESQYINPKFSNINTLRVVEVKGFLEGIYMCRCIEEGITPIIVEVAPMEAKKFIGVVGRENSKKKLKFLVEQRFPEIEKINQDEADAIAIGLTGIEKLRSQQLLQKYKDKI